MFWTMNKILRFKLINLNAYIKVKVCSNTNFQEKQIKFKFKKHLGTI